MRRVVAAAASLLVVVGCASGGPQPTPSPETPGQSSSSSNASAASSTPATPSEPASAPSVKGAWKKLDAKPLLTDAEIDAAPVPESLKSYLKETVLDVVTENRGQEGDAENCPVETRIIGYHPAGFAMVSVTGCGPEESVGVVAQEGDGWVPAVFTSPDAPACQELAEAGVPTGVPYLNGEPLHCNDNDGSVRAW